MRILVRIAGSDQSRLEQPSRGLPGKRERGLRKRISPSLKKEVKIYFLFCTVTRIFVL